MTVPVAPPPSPPRRAPRSRLVLAGLGGVAVAGLALAAARFSRPVGGKTPGHATAPAAAGSGVPAPRFQPQVESRIFQVAETSGRVEVMRNGVWTLVNPGDVLTQDDVVRTTLGRALLKRGPATEIELRDRVEIRLDSISGDSASVDLRRGKLLAHVGRMGDNVAITAAHTRTANLDAQPARFVVTADEHGRVAVATTEGAARFEAAGRAVTVTAGHETRAEPGGPPRDPEKIAEDVLLTVAWPSGERHEEKLPITGQVGPGSLVRVNGAPASMDQDGHFAASIAMRTGPNPVEVQVEDVAGRAKSERREIKKIATRPPDLTTVPVELWKK